MLRSSRANDGGNFRKVRAFLLCREIRMMVLNDLLFWDFRLDFRLMLKIYNDPYSYQKNFDFVIKSNIDGECFDSKNGWMSCCWRGGLAF